MILRTWCLIWTMKQLCQCRVSGIWIMNQQFFQQINAITENKAYSIKKIIWKKLQIILFKSMCKISYQRRFMNQTAECYLTATTMATTGEWKLSYTSVRDMARFKQIKSEHILYWFKVIIEHIDEKKITAIQQVIYQSRLWSILTQVYVLWNRTIVLYSISYGLKGHYNILLLVIASTVAHCT